jgi:hypothetical protein
MKIGELNLEEAAKEAAGNWRHFHCFVWFRDRELNDADQWAIIYTHHRDSGLLDQSNAAVIEKAMKPFSEGDDPNVVFESHNHWAVGHVDGFSVRVFKNGEITKAFEKYHDLARQLDDYPILDESDYSDREFEATSENIEDAAWKLKHDFDLPEGWESEVYSWLSDNRCGEIENVDDLGGYPSEEALKAAFDALGFEPQKDSASTT